MINVGSLLWGLLKYAAGEKEAKKRKLAVETLTGLWNSTSENELALIENEQKVQQIKKKMVQKVH